MTDSSTDLSRRERQIMDFLYRAGRASAADVHKGIPDPPSYSAVRATLRILETKGHVRHEEEGRAYVFLPTTKKEAARRKALAHVVRTFFDNSMEQTVSALMEIAGPKLGTAELDRLRQVIDRAKEEGR
jgi:predicted transcriptional regulator